jgi:bifunctional non-homologous end joining protein LigD
VIARKDGKRMRLYWEDLRSESLINRNAALHIALVGVRDGIELNDHMEHDDAAVVFQHACKLGFEGIISKRKDSPYRSGRSPDWIKLKNPKAPAVKREAEEDWGK